MKPCSKTQQEYAQYVNDLKFETFDMVKEFKNRKNFACSITAKRNSGKSVFMRDICFQIKDWYQEVYVFSLSAHLQPDLFSFIKKENVITEFNEAKLLDIWKSQESMVLKMKQLKVEPDKIPKVLILFDDIIGSEKVRNSSVLNNFFILGRHLHFAVMIITQEMGGKFGLSKVVRANLDLAVAFFLNAEGDRKLFVEQYLSTNNKKVGYLIYDKIAHQAYNSIVILNFKTEKDPTEYVRTYLAREKIPKFKMGTEADKSITSRFFVDGMERSFISKGNIFG